MPQASAAGAAVCGAGRAERWGESERRDLWGSPGDSGGI